VQITELQLALGERIIPLRFAEAGAEWLVEEIARLVGNQKPRLLLVSDERVALHYEEDFSHALRERGFAVCTHVFPCGEEHKTLRRIEELVDHLAEEIYARDDLIVALGGGVVTDLAGFAAAIYKRGIEWIACPTSLMGMADAAIGGKTGADHPLGKNLIGAFYQPKAVFAAMKLLDTLNVREWRSGAAEVIKSALLEDGIWNDVKMLGPNLFEWPRGSVQRGIVHAARVKAQLVAQDEKDFGARRLLNLGHTFGHALETVTGYRAFKHGEAVFWGLRGAVQLSHDADFLSKENAREIDDVLARMPLPRVKVAADGLMSALQQDKKSTAQRQNWVLLRERGQAFVTADVKPNIVRSVAEWMCEAAPHGMDAEQKSERLRLLVINGPNLNLLGEREPDVYGTTTYDELVQRLRQYGEREQVDIMVRQSNVEGEIVNLIQRGRRWANGIVINAGGYTHTSVAIRDALHAVKLPAAEVHISDILQREDFRRTSLIRDVCAVHCYGQGVAGYEQAIAGLLKLLRSPEPLAAA
jgi:3-dehydroquinate synthase